jgi:sulfopropanediol 3-dehydrogenase
VRAGRPPPPAPPPPPPPPPPAGLSVARFLKQLTYQKATREATEAQAGPVVTIADFEGMPGHRDSAQLRLDLLARD